MEPITEQIAAAVCALPKHNRPLLVAIDGRCGAGKTTIAEQLRQRIGCTVVHMDHFFLRREQRSEQRLQTPGENVDHERFLAEVLLPLRRGLPFTYRPYDCKAQALGEPIPIVPGEICVVEGSYACHRALWPYYDLRIFLTVDPETQLERIRARGGDAVVPVFRERWIPLEEAYFSDQRIEERCDLRFRT